MPSLTAYRLPLTACMASLAFLLAVPASPCAQTPDTLEASRLLQKAIDLNHSGGGQYAQALALAREGKDRFAAALGDQHIRVADAWYWMGGTAKFLPNERSQEYFYNAWRIYKTHMGERHFRTVTTRMEADVLYCYQGKYEQCLTLLKEDIVALEQNPQAPPKSLARAYLNYGRFSADEGNSEDALLFLHRAAAMYKGLNKAENATTTSKMNEAVAYGTMASILDQEDDPEGALWLRLKFLDHVNKLLAPTHPNVTTALLPIAQNYLQIGQPDSALWALQPALKNFITGSGPAHPSLIRFYNLMGNIYRKKAQPVQAMQYWQKALLISRIPGNHTFRTLTFPLYSDLADYYFSGGQYEKALAWCDSVVVHSRFDAERGGVLVSSEHWVPLASALSKKAQILQQWLALEDTPERRAAFQQAQANFGICLKEMKTPGAESVLSANITHNMLLPATEAALDFERQTQNYPANRVARQFAAAQAAKAEALAFGFQSNRIQHIAGLPDSLLQAEKQTKKELAELRAKSAEAVVANDSTALRQLRDQQFEKKRDFERLEAQIESLNPRLNRLRAAPPPLEAVRQKLLADKHTALLEFFVGQGSIYVFRLTHQDAQSWKVERPADFDSLVSRYHRALGDHRLLRANPALSRQLYTESALRLYDLLLRPALETMPQAVQRLIIVPDASLYYLAFEALLTEAPAPNEKYADFDFLIKKYAVSYGYSAALLMEQNAAPERRPYKNFAGFAPQYESAILEKDDTIATRSLAWLVRGGHYGLPGAQAEVSAIADLLGGEIFQGDHASEATFRQQSGQFRVLHLAMHALVNDQNPALSRLLFSTAKPDSLFDNQLSVGEIYSLSLSADLAVLTACNSGFGRLRRGEGTMSLARAFTFAGVRSTVMSLWQAPDARTQVLMVLFYQRLQAGMPKDEALRQAKIALLGAGENPELGHPFFWAGCVLNGNTEALNLSESRTSRTGWFLVLLCLLAAGLLFRRIRGNKIPAKNLPES